MPNRSDYGVLMRELGSARFDVEHAEHDSLPARSQEVLDARKAVDGAAESVAFLLYSSDAEIAHATAVARLQVEQARAMARAARAIVEKARADREVVRQIREQNRIRRGSGDGPDGPA